jgi:hypothetical protein
MPLLTVENLESTDLILTDSKKSFPPITVPADDTLTDHPISGVDLEKMGPLLTQLSDDSKINYTVTPNPDVDDAFELGSAVAGAVADGSITTAKLGANAVTAAKLAEYASAADVTATGSAQSIAHSLGVVPAFVLVVPVAGHDGMGGAGSQMPTITQGTHTTTNVVVTVTGGAKFRVLALA